LKILTVNFRFKSKDVLKIVEIENENPASLLKKYMETIKENPNNVVYFPILINSHEGEYCYLRYPKRLEEDGLIMWGDVPDEGEFTFINQYDVSERIKNLLVNELDKTLPSWDLILVANCVGKSLFADPKKEYEVLKNHTRKPFIFVGTLGEINSVDKQPFLLNGTLNLLAIKEIVEE